MEPERTYRVYYPSGAHSELTGVLYEPGLIGGEPVLRIDLSQSWIPPTGATADGVPVCMVPSGSPVFLDPRCVLVSDDFSHSPRDVALFVNTWVSAWLEEHDEWPAILELGL